MRKLGHIQESVLNALGERKSWHRGCGWVWDTHCGTERVLESLHRRGMVDKTPGPATVFGEGNIYRITDAGRKYLEKNDA